MQVLYKEWNALKIIGKVDQVLEKAGAVYAEQATTVMSNPLWDWDWDTLRFESLLMGGERKPGSRGVVVNAGKRDVVDTGKLLDSITGPTVSSRQYRSTMAVGWTAPYAKLVAYGGYYGPGYRNPDGVWTPLGNRPARNWVEKTFELNPADRVFADIWKSFKVT